MRQYCEIIIRKIGDAITFSVVRSSKMSAALFLITLLSYQNCSETKLSRPPDTSMFKMASQAGKAIVMPKVTSKPYARLMIIFDMSNSNILGACSQDPLDVDFQNPKNKPLNQKGCRTGHDFGDNRIEWIKSWIDAFKNNPEINGTVTDAFKVSLIPFAGGEQKFKRQERAMMNFNESSFALTQLNELTTGVIRPPLYPSAKQQVQQSGRNSIVQGTTIPMDAFKDAIHILREELDDLENKKVAHDTRFDVIFVTDGVLRPRIKDFKEIVGKCFIYMNSSNEVCKTIKQRGEAEGDDEAIREAFRCEICTKNKDDTNNENKGNVHRALASLGNPYDNIPRKIWFRVLELTNKVLESGYGNNLKFYLAQPNPEKIPEEDNQPLHKIKDLVKDEDQINILQFLSNRMKLPIHQGSDSNPPTSLQSMSAHGKSWRISDFIAVNLNTRIGPDGNLIIDSDADGLSDDVDPNPKNPKSINGVCLDGITRGYGCQTDQKLCSSSVDKDGDGLNECEELTLNLFDTQIDTDHDGIPDFYEFLYHTHLMDNDQNVDDSSPYDGFSNKMAFLKGADPYIDLKSVPTQKWVSTELRSLGNDQTTGRAKYYFRVMGMPMIQSQPQTLSFPTYRAKNKNLETKISSAMSFGGTNHAAEENQLVYIIRAVSTVDPLDDVWFLYRINHNYFEKKIAPIEIQKFKVIY